MGLFNKIKGILFEEVEDDEVVDTPKPKVSEVKKPIAERIEPQKREEVVINTPPKVEVPKEVKHDQINERDLFKSDNTFPFQEFDEKEFESMSRVNKPKQTTNVLEYEKKKNPRNKIFIVHRLDKDTSGLVLFAKNEKIKYALQNNWDKVIRKYYAVVEKEVLENKTLINYLQESKTGEVFVTNNKVMGKKSITKYEVLSKNNKCSLLDIEIKTGRKNQIRVQLAYVHHPIIGDKKYGNTKNKELLLQAYYLKFNHPVDNKEIIIKTDIEKSLTSYLQ